MSNGDILLHTWKPRDRFILFETKTPFEPAIQSGQGTLLRALARQAGWVVRLLRGTLDKLELHRVSSAGVDRDSSIVTPSALRASTVDYLNGLPWRDPAGRAGPSVVGHREHIHGYARVGDSWVCVQDYYASGNDPTSGCGATWEPAA